MVKLNDKQVGELLNAAKDNSDLRVLVSTDDFYERDYEYNHHLNSLCADDLPTFCLDGAVAHNKNGVLRVILADNTEVRVTFAKEVPIQSILAYDDITKVDVEINEAENKIDLTVNDSVAVTIAPIHDENEHEDKWDYTLLSPALLREYGLNAREVLSGLDCHLQSMNSYCHAVRVSPDLHSGTYDVNNLMSIVLSAQYVGSPDTYVEELRRWWRRVVKNSNNRLY